MREGVLTRLGVVVFGLVFFVAVCLVTGFVVGVEGESILDVFVVGGVYFVVGVAILVAGVGSVTVLIRYVVYGE